ncbi:MAG: hypothetical protein ABEJ55_07820 [Halanaeroarchaeum sp.]
MARLDNALTYIDEARSIGGFGENFIAGLSALVLFLFTGIMGIGEAIVNLFVQPTDATAGGIAAMIRANLEGPASYIQSAWNTAATSMGLDPWNTLGPFIVVVAALVVIMFLFIIYEFYDYMDWDAPGWDVPWLQADEGGDMDDEV